VLLGVVTAEGEDEEWADAVMQEDAAVVRGIIACLQASAPPMLRTIAVQLLFILNQLLPEVLRRTVVGEWGLSLQGLLALCSSGLWNAIMGCEYKSTIQAWPPRLGGSRRKSVSAWHAGAVDGEAAATWLMYAASVLHACKAEQVPLPRSVLCSFLAVMLDATAVVPWTVQCRVAWTDAMTAVYNSADGDFDPILAVAVGDARGRAIADGLLAVLQNSTQFTEGGNLTAPEATVSSALQLLQHMLSRAAPAAVLFVADLHVVVDIALRELENGGAGSKCRQHWVSLLRVLLLDGRLAPRALPKQVYRLDDIAACMEGLLQVDGAASDAGSDNEDGDTDVAQAVARLTEETSFLWE
jgi:hypothetical protein